MNCVPSIPGMAMSSRMSSGAGARSISARASAPLSNVLAEQKPEIREQAGVKFQDEGLVVDHQDSDR